jgi:hypothetical protein
MRTVFDAKGRQFFKIIFFLTPTPLTCEKGYNTVYYLVTSNTNKWEVKKVSDLIVQFAEVRK